MRSVLAVASNTIKQAIRMKIAAVFILLLLVLIPVMGLATTGDGTLKGKVQSFVNYSLSLTILLLSILTIIASIHSVTSDLTEKQIFTVLTKPIRRFEFLAGKLLGIIILDIFLLAMFSALIYGVTIGMSRFTLASPQEQFQLQDEFFTARKSVKPIQPNISKQVEAEYDKLKDSGQLEQLYPGDSKARIISDLTYKNQQSQQTAARGYEIVWKFENVKLIDPNEGLFIRFKYEVLENPADLQISGIWTIGDDRHIEQSPTPIRTLQQKDLIRTDKEIHIPGDVVASDGYVAVGFFNDPRSNNDIVLFPNNIELLYKADTFTANFIRVVLMLLMRLIFLACLGILAASFLSFPVAILLCLMVLVCGSISGFILESISYLGQNIGMFYRYTILPIVHFLPQFDTDSPCEFMVAGRLLSWPVFFKALGILVGIKAVLLFLLAILIFAYREIAKVII